MSSQLSMMSASLIVFARGDAPAVCCRSMALRTARLPSPGLLTSVSSLTSCVTSAPNSRSRSSNVAGVSSTVSCSQAAAIIASSSLTEATSSATDFR